MTSSISINIHGQNVKDVGKLKTFLEKLKPKWAVVMNNTGLADQLALMFPDTNFALRFWPDGNLPDVTTGGTWVNAHANFVRYPNQYLYTTNEPLSAISGTRYVQLKKINDWHVDALRRANQLSVERRGQDKPPVSLVVFNTGVGSPEPDEWQYLQPMLDLLGTQHVLGLHEYWCDVPTSGMSNPPEFFNWDNVVNNTKWHCGRFNFLRSNVRIVITEHGPDELQDVQCRYRGWRTLESVWRNRYNKDPQDVYADMLIWLAKKVYNDSRIEGQCIFSYGNSGGWEQFDIEQADTLLNRLTAFSSETPEVPETPETPDTPEVPEIPEIPEVPEVPSERTILSLCGKEFVGVSDCAIASVGDGWSFLAHTAYGDAEDIANLLLMSGDNFWVDDANEPLRRGYYDWPNDAEEWHVIQTYQFGAWHNRVFVRRADSDPEFVYAVVQYKDNNHGCSTFKIPYDRYISWERGLRSLVSVG